MKKVVLLVIVSLCIAGASTRAFAQFPLPTPPGGAMVGCYGCPSVRTGIDDATKQPIVGNPPFPYSDPIVNFTGRFLDSNFTRDHQQPFRTARAWKAVVNPDTKRLYVLMGSAVVAYDLNTFFGRLEGKEGLVSALQGYQGNSRGGDSPEHWLKWDKFFYAENSKTGWNAPIVDGQERLSSFDWDDRGYIYMAYSLFGWGIALDDMANDGKLMVSQKQVYSGNDGFTPQEILAFKTSGNRYYAIVGPQRDGTMRLFDTTDPKNPIRQPYDPATIINGSKTTSGDRVAGVTLDGKLRVYVSDSLVQAGQPIIDALPSGGTYKSVSTDGTNFYAVARLAGGKLGVNILTRTGSGYTQNLITTNAQLEPYSARFGSGYLAIHGMSQAGQVNGDYVSETVLLYKVAGGVLEEVNFNNYFFRHYVRNDPNYSKPSRGGLSGVLPYRHGSKLYLTLSAIAIGDVYQIKADDAITVEVTAPAANNIFYGDRISVIARNASNSTPQKSISWDFGNPEAAAGADSNTNPSGATAVGVSYQYSGIGRFTTPITRTIKATAPGADATAVVTLKSPAAKFEVSGYSKFLFTQPDASSAAPIVMGDSFIDKSDGDLSGHYAQWTIDGSSQFTAAQGLTSVGDCGAHTLNFSAHYGSLSGFTVRGTPHVASIGAVNYSVRPFAAAVSAPVEAGANMSFTSNSRFSTVNASLPNPAGLTWKWEILESTDQPSTAVTAVSGVGRVIPPFLVPKSAFTTATGRRAQLTIASPTAPGGTCANFATSVATSAAVNGPDPVITQSCPGGGPTCTFGVTSPSGADPNSWTSFVWSAVGSGTVLPNSHNGSGNNGGANYTATFGAVGTYTVSLTATNPIGSKLVSTQVPITTASTCPQMNVTNVFPTWRGASSGCTQGSGNCFAGESIVFDVAGFQYPFDCYPNFTYTWDNGAVGKSITRTFGSNGNQPVWVNVFNGAQTFKAEGTVKVGGSAPNPTPNPPNPNPPTPNPPTPNPPAPGSCPLMSVTNVFLTFRGAASNCSQNGGTCSSTEQIQFDVAGFNYDFTCNPNTTFSWNFGASGRQQSRTMPAGSNPVSVTIFNGTQSFTATGTVVVGGGGTPTPNPPTPNPPNPNPPTGNCAQLTATSAFINFRNNGNTCNQQNPACQMNQVLDFSVSFYQYNPECAAHSYSWDFGGGVIKSGKDQQHVYTTNGDRTVKLTVSNGSQSRTYEQLVVIGNGGSPILPDVTVDFTSEPLPPTPNRYLFTPTVTPATGNGITSYQWDFGDGKPKVTVSSAEAVVHTYAAPGNYKVTLTVLNASGQSVAPPHTESLAPARRRSAGR